MRKYPRGDSGEAACTTKCTLLDTIFYNKELNNPIVVYNNIIIKSMQLKNLIWHFITVKNGTYYSNTTHLRDVNDL